MSREVGVERQMERMKMSENMTTIETAKERGQAEETAKRRATEMETTEMKRTIHCLNCHRWERGEEKAMTPARHGLQHG